MADVMKARAANPGLSADERMSAAQEAEQHKMNAKDAGHMKHAASRGNANTNAIGTGNVVTGPMSGMAQPGMAQPGMMGEQRTGMM